jgi:hypothetical protein
MPRNKLAQQYDESKEVGVSEKDFREGPVLFYTDGLGPCIGVCIAWKTWAGIAHLGSLDEHDELPKFIVEAKDRLPPNVVPQIHPIVCGGDPEDFGEHIAESRKVVLETLEKAGFPKPNLHWNSPGETTSLVAYLDHGLVCVESDRPGRDEEDPIAMVEPD